MTQPPKGQFLVETGFRSFRFFEHQIIVLVMARVRQNGESSLINSVISSQSSLEAGGELLAAIKHLYEAERERASASVAQLLAGKSPRPPS